MRHDLGRGTQVDGGRSGALYQGRLGGLAAFGNYGALFLRLARYFPDCLGSGRLAGRLAGFLLAGDLSGLSRRRDDVVQGLFQSGGHVCF